MDEYVSLRDIPKYFGIEKGDSVWLASDAKRLIYSCIEHGEEADMNVLLDGIIDIIGPEGTLLIPTFNWDFCKGVTFDIKKSPCKTGIIGKAALKREDFQRTKHPLYSFAVWGRDADLLVAMENKSSFGADSPFMYCKEHNTKNVFIDVECQHSFTFVHFVEEMCGITYRYLKDFTADYIDINGEKSTRTYSMNVRDLDKDIFITIYPFEEEFTAAGAARRYTVNDIPMKTIEMGKTYDIIARDVKENRSRKICTYTGQDD
ncbi:MAG: AAC(3) family N-acetyltransferase [Lachnospiraceae bacterium]|nr:AAC(3) family N-acetyltransferase [Lachnospiraceae bacterium]